MRAVVCTRYGPPEVLQLADVEPPRPKKGQVRIRIVATAVTASDCNVRTLEPRSLLLIGARLVLGLTAPRQPILGLVLAGEVESLGPGVTSFKVGDSVIGFTGAKFGTYAEFVCCREDGYLATRPANLTYAQAAAIPYGGLLALPFLRKAGVGPGKRVLIYGASGAIGTSAVQLARHLGAEVTGVCSGVNVELVRSLGAVTVVDYTKEDFTRRGERYDTIFDAVGKRKSAKALVESRKALTPDGVVLSVDDGLAKVVRSDLFLLQSLAQNGELKPVIDRTYPLEQIVEAHRYVDHGHKRGNVIVTVALEI